jgi:hypothetical protein
MNKTELEQSMKARIDELESNIAVLKKEMAVLQEVEKPEKWEPKGGNYYICIYADGSTGTIYHVGNRLGLLGLSFPTREAAESARDARIFFQRLQCLAAELNPSGRVGGDWFIRYDSQHKDNLPWYSFSMGSKLSTCDAMFETQEAAKKAAEILNRDGVKPPVTAS